MAANITQLVAFAGYLSMFFFVTLYMQEVLHFSLLQAGIAYLPVTGAFATIIALRSGDTRDVGRSSGSASLATQVVTEGRGERLADLRAAS